MLQDISLASKIGLALVCMSPLFIGVVQGILRNRIMRQQGLTYAHASGVILRDFPLVIAAGLALPTAGVVLLLLADGTISRVRWTPSGGVVFASGWLLASAVIGGIWAYAMIAFRTTYERLRRPRVATAPRAGLPRGAVNDRLRALSSMRARAWIALANVFEEFHWRAFALGIALPLLGLPTWISVLIAALGYGILLHYAWGLRETVVHSLSGIVYGTLFVLAGGAWTVALVAHVTFNLVSLAHLERTMRSVPRQVSAHY